MICTLCLNPHNMQLGAELAHYCKKLSKKLADLLKEEELSDGRTREGGFVKLYAQSFIFFFFSVGNRLTLTYTKACCEEERKAAETDDKEWKKLERNASLAQDLNILNALQYMLCSDSPSIQLIFITLKYYTQWQFKVTANVLVHRSSRCLLHTTALHCLLLPKKMHCLNSFLATPQCFYKYTISPTWDGPTVLHEPHHVVSMVTTYSRRNSACVVECACVFLDY